MPDKDGEIVKLENSLIQFLMNKKDIDSKISGGVRRLRSLTFNITGIDSKTALFSVQIGMCEAVFNAQSGLREKGSCFGLEHYIRDWFLMSTINRDIKNYIQEKRK